MNTPKKIANPAVLTFVDTKEELAARLVCGNIFERFIVLRGFGPLASMAAVEDSNFVEEFLVKQTTNMLNSAAGAEVENLDSLLTGLVNILDTVTKDNKIIAAEIEKEKKEQKNMNSYDIMSTLAEKRTGETDLLSEITSRASNLARFYISGFSTDGDKQNKRLFGRVFVKDLFDYVVEMISHNTLDKYSSAEKRAVKKFEVLRAAKKLGADIGGWAIKWRKWTLKEISALEEASYKPPQDEQNKLPPPNLRDLL